MSKLAPPAGTLFLATLYRWGDMKSSVTVLFGGHQQTFDELRAELAAHAAKLASRTVARGERYILSLHVVHPGEQTPCHLGEEFTITIPMVDRFFRGAVAHMLGEMLDTLERTVAGATADQRQARVH